MEFIQISRIKTYRSNVTKCKIQYKSKTNVGKIFLIIIKNITKCYLNISKIYCLANEYKSTFDTFKISFKELLRRVVQTQILLYLTLKNKKSMRFFGSKITN